MTRLLRDLVRRGWAVLLILAGVAFLSAGQLTRHSVGTSVTMILVLMLGGHMIGTFLPLRTIHVLPVTTRDRWGAAVGVMAVVMPATWITATLLGLMLPWSPGRLAVEPLVIVTLFTALYSTAALLWLPAFESAGRWEPAAVINLKGPSAQPRLEARGLGKMLVLLGVALALLIAPLRWSHLVPLHFADFSLATLAVFLLVGSVALGAALWTPPDTTLQPKRGLSADVLGPPDSYLLTQKRRLDVLSGPARVLVPSFLGIGLATCAVLMLWSVIGFFVVAESRELVPALRELGILLLEPQSNGSDPAGRSLVMVIVMLALSSPLAGLHRLLVVLPTSHPSRVALPILGQAGNLMAIWCALIGFHLVMTGSWPSNVATEMLGLALGLTALLHAVADRFGWSVADLSDGRRGLVLGGASAMANISSSIWLATVEPHIHTPLALAIGGVGLVAAVVLRLRMK